MGCCFSTNKSPPSNKTGHISISISKTTTTKRGGGVSKSPPPSNPLLEEETVKEVLSETPALPKPPSPPIPKFQTKQESPFIKAAPLLQDNHRQNGKARYLAFAADDLSEASEICSTLSESVSASTSVTEKRETNGDRRAEFRDQRQRSPARLRNRQFSGEMLREKTVGRSPARRCEPSPGRARPPVPASASGYGRRRENGESSGRRSRSPVTRAESGLGRAPSARKTGKSPGRVGPGAVEKIRKLDGGKGCGDSKWAANESIENPLVSLECFIFL